MRLLRQVLSSFPLPLSLHRWFFTTSGTWLASSFRADAGTDRLGGAMYKTQALACNQELRAHPAGPRPLIAEGRKRYLKILSSLPSHFSQATAAAVSKCVPSFHIRPRRTASFRATATRAFFGPSVLRSFRPQLRKAKRFLTVVSSTLAASYK